MNLTVSKRSVQAVVPMLAIAVGDGDTPNQRSESVVYRSGAHEQTATPKEAVLSSFDDVTSQASYKITVSTGAEWSDALEEEFLGLAELAALQEIDHAGSTRLKELSQMRSCLKHRRSFADLLFYAKKEKARAEFFDAMRKFLLANSPAGRWQGAKRNK